MIGTAAAGKPASNDHQALRQVARSRSLALVAALAGAVLVRVALNGTSTPTAMTAGALFGSVLLLVALRTSLRPWAIRGPGTGLVGLGLGLAGAVVLIALPGLLQPLPVPGLGLHPEPFLAWVVVTTIVVVGEEAILRGVLFDALGSALGRPAAVILTSVAFALIHVPLYGWHVVPLDFAVGLWLAGLRLVSGGIAAPAIAHVLADLATWWL